jgi:hypothetical protein
MACVRKAGDALSSIYCAAHGGQPVQAVLEGLVSTGPSKGACPFAHLLDCGCLVCPCELTPSVDGLLAATAPEEAAAAPATEAEPAAEQQ